MLQLAIFFSFVLFFKFKKRKKVPNKKKKKRNIYQPWGKFASVTVYTMTFYYFLKSCACRTILSPPGWYCYWLSENPRTKISFFEKKKFKHCMVFFFPFCLRHYLFGCDFNVCCLFSRFKKSVIFEWGKRNELARLKKKKKNVEK